MEAWRHRESFCLPGHTQTGQTRLDLGHACNEGTRIQPRFPTQVARTELHEPSTVPSGMDILLRLESVARAMLQTQALLHETQVS